jgi:hypothetical protein
MRELLYERTPSSVGRTCSVGETRARDVDAIEFRFLATCSLFRVKLNCFRSVCIDVIARFGKVLRTIGTAAESRNGAVKRNATYVPVDVEVWLRRRPYMPMSLKTPGNGVAAVLIPNEEQGQSARERKVRLSSLLPHCMIAQHPHGIRRVCRQPDHQSAVREKDSRCVGLNASSHRFLQIRTRVLWRAKGGR